MSSTSWTTMLPAILGAGGYLSGILGLFRNEKKERLDSVRRAMADHELQSRHLAMLATANSRVIAQTDCPPDTRASIEMMTRVYVATIKMHEEAALVLDAEAKGLIAEIEEDERKAKEAREATRPRIEEELVQARTELRLVSEQKSELMKLMWDLNAARDTICAERDALRAERDKLRAELTNLRGGGGTPIF